ncbi:hypothetical protein ACHWQZ_G008542 [Mnemiopsis leidyi]
MPFHKIVVMGDRNVGKTAMSMMYVYGRFPPEYRPTSEDVYIKSLEQPLKGKGTIYLHFWDTSGSIVSTDPDDRRTRFHYYNIADVVMLVYDAQNEESQQKVDSLKIEINTAQQLQGKKPSIFVVENRSNSTGNCSPMKQPSDSNSSIPPITPDFRVSTLQKNEVDTCIEQMLQACQLGIGSSGNSIKRASSRTSVHSMSTIKSVKNVLQK